RSVAEHPVRDAFPPKRRARVRSRAISCPPLGGTEMRQSGRVRAVSVVKGITYRMLRHRARDRPSSRKVTPPKALTNAGSASFRPATDGAKPSSRKTVEDSGRGNPSNQDAT